MHTRSRSSCVYFESVHRLEPCSLLDERRLPLIEGRDTHSVSRDTRISGVVWTSVRIRTNGDCRIDETRSNAADCYDCNTTKAVVNACEGELFN
ncbi:DUF7692 domain-containing protein [Natrinema longum]|uniref:DUF7692 domain-containing protein n=1 Tax=Natrinema longum TaxID=370324 RepID=UPI003CCCBAA8